METQNGGVTTKGFDVQKANQVRNLIQSNAVNLIRNNKHVLLTWATGCGKTLAALKMVDDILKVRPDAVGYLICKEHSHLSNWDADMDKHKMSHVHNAVTMFLYDSLHKFTQKVDFIVLDECHAITERRLEFLMDVVGPSTQIIMLSATVDDLKRELLRALCGGKYIESHISISTAIERGLLPSPKLYVHYYGLDNTVANQVYVFEQGKKDYRIKKACTIDKAKEFINRYKDLELHVKCTEEQKYQLISAEMSKYKTKFMITRDEWAKNLWVNMGSQRKRIMAEIKTRHAKKLIKEKFKGSRFICFTGSKKQCEDIGGTKFVHSDLKSKEVVSKKDEFNEGKINELYVVNMFRESINLVNVEKGLIVQLDNVKLSFIQMLGRVFRSDFPEMHVMVLKGTQDEKYYRNIIKGFNKDYIIVINH